MLFSSPCRIILRHNASDSFDNGRDNSKKYITWQTYSILNIWSTHFLAFSAQYKNNGYFQGIKRHNKSQVTISKQQTFCWLRRKVNLTATNDSKPSTTGTPISIETVKFRHVRQKIDFNQQWTAARSEAQQEQCIGSEHIHMTTTVRICTRSLITSSPPQQARSVAEGWLVSTFPVSAPHLSPSAAASPSPCSWMVPCHKENSK